MRKYKEIISKFSKMNILVLGDIILDRYVLGSVSRISPEAPVPIVLEHDSFYTPGGAANVSNNLKALGAKVTQVGKIGNDFEGSLLKRKLKQSGINTQGVFLDRKVPTITKTRVMAQRQQVLRIDKEQAKNFGDQSINKKINLFIKQNINQYDALIISDYGKGLITSELVDFVCEMALKEEKILTVDPKVEHFSYYRNVTAITPNKKEAENAIRDIKIKDDKGHRLSIKNDTLDTLKQIDQAGDQLVKFLNLKSLLITLGDEGMRLYEKGKKPVSIKTQAKEVFDVTGAGDTVISTFTLCLTAGASKSVAAKIANSAAGIVVGRMGAVAVTKEELSKALKDH